MQHINKIGIELEGYWHKKPNSAKADGSVHASCPGDTCQHVINGGSEYSGYRGELASRPILIRSLDKWIDTNYPDHVDSSCGLHVHMSLTNQGDYARLTYPDFWDYFLDSWEQWGEDNDITNKNFWSRLAGNNAYCYRDFNPGSQWRLTYKDSSRYKHLNFCFTLHKTVECRLLPMFKRKDIAKNAIWHLISIVNAFLDIAPSLPELSCEVLIEDDWITKEITGEIEAVSNVAEEITIFPDLASADIRELVTV